MHFIRKGIKIL